MTIRREVNALGPDSSDHFIAPFLVRRARAWNSYPRKTARAYPTTSMYVVLSGRCKDCRPRRKKTKNGVAEESVAVEPLR